MKKPNFFQRIIPPSIWKDPAKNDLLTSEYLIVYSLGDGDLPVTGSGHYNSITKKWYHDIDNKIPIEDGVFLYAELPDTPKGFDEDEMPVNEEDFKVERMLKKIMKDDPTFYIRRENFEENPISNFYHSTQEAMEAAKEAAKEAEKTMNRMRLFVDVREYKYFGTNGIEAGGVREMDTRDIEIAVGKRLVVKFKKLHEKAVLPVYAKPGDAGLDLYPVSCETIDGNIVCSFGFAMQIPEGYVGLVFPRSGIYKHSYVMSNSVGVIDSGYRGEVKAILKFSNYAPSFYDFGQAVAQLIIIPYPQIETVWADKLSDTIRGEGGFGHTDKR